MQIVFSVDDEGKWSVRTDGMRKKDIPEVLVMLEILKQAMLEQFRQDNCGIVIEATK